MVKRYIQLGVSLGFCVLLAIEFFLSLHGKSLCTQQSCRSVDFLSPAHTLMVFLGIVYFLTYALGVLTGRDWLIETVSLCGVSAETILFLRQACEYHTFCVLCAVVAAGVFTTAAFGIRTRRDTAVCFACILSSAVLFALTAIPMRPVKQNVTLIYSPSCPHCERVLQFCRQKGIDLSLCRETNVRGLLYCLGIKGVPALLVKEKGGVRIIEGESSVLAYLGGIQKPSPQITPESLFGPPRSDICTPGAECQ